MKQLNVLLIAYGYDYADWLKEQVKIDGVYIWTCVTLDEVQRVFKEESIDIVLLGTDKENLKSRLKIIEFVAYLDDYPSIHFRGKGVDSEQFIYAIVQSTWPAEK